MQRIFHISPSDYDWLLFMNKFLHDFSSPIERDDRIHIEYVPTQVITEYLRDAKLGGEAAGRRDQISKCAQKGRRLLRAFH